MNNPKQDIIIKASKLSHHFGSGHLYSKVLSELEFEVKPKDRTAIVGSSGSGKSTLLHLLGGLDTPSSGTIELMGQSLSTMSANQRAHCRNQHLGFIYQFHHLLPEFSALDNVAMPLFIRGEKVSQARLKAESLLKRVGLAKRLAHQPSELSGGERQRCAIARAIITEPACLLADEPTGNLDQKNAHQVIELLLELHQNSDMALVLVTHDQEVAAMMDVLWRLQAGQLSHIT